MMDALVLLGCVVSLVTCYLVMKKSRPRWIEIYNRNPGTVVVNVGELHNVQVGPFTWRRMNLVSANWRSGGTTTLDLHLEHSPTMVLFSHVLTTSKKDRNDNILEDLVWPNNK